MPAAIREKLVRGLDMREVVELDKSYEKFLDLIKESSLETFHENYQVFRKNHPNSLKHLHHRFIFEANKALKTKFIGRPVGLTVNIFALHAVQKGKEKWIQCKGFVGNKWFEGLISCGYWHKLKLTDYEMRAGNFNLMDHLSELVPSSGKQLGFFTFQNGINNSFDDFKIMGNSILQHLPENPLCIGLYNPTKGMFNDLSGVLEKLEGCLSDTICMTHQFFITLSEKLFKINPSVLWAYIGHSEGGLIAETALTMLSEQRWNSYLKHNLLIATYGAVLPIPKSYAKAINTYSSKDGATLPRVQSYLQSLGEKAEDYEIKIVEGNATSNLPFLPFGFTGLVLKALFEHVKGDHDFQGSTYQKALEFDIKNFFRSGRQIYDGR